MNQYKKIKVKHLILCVCTLLFLSFFLIACRGTRRYLQVDCKPLKSYRSIIVCDYSKCKDRDLDSLQFRDHLLSYSDTSDKVIEGLALLEKCYKFDYGLVMIVAINSKQYEVITLVDPNSAQVDKLVPRRKYQMKIKPYFYLDPNKYGGHSFRRPIYLDHYVIYPLYLLRWEEKICTANFKDIVL